MLRSPPSDWNDLNSPGKSCGVCGLCHRLCSMNIWCRVHDASGALKRNLYSLQMPVFLWVALITEQIEETQMGGGVLGHRRTHGSHYRVGGWWLWVFKHLPVCALSSFCLCYSSLWLLVSPHRLTRMLSTDWHRLNEIFLMGTFIHVGPQTQR